MDNFDLKKYLTEGRLLKENIDFPELEYEFEKTMRSIVVKPEVYFQGIIDASAEEIVSDDYYEIMNAVEMGTYSAEEAVKLAKAWAKEKLLGLDEGKIHEVFGMFNKKEKLYVPKGINQLHKYVYDRQVKDIEAKIKSKEISPKQLLGINSVMMAVEEFLKAKSGIIENEKNGIKFLIYPTGKAGGLTDNKLDLYINLPQKGKPNNLRTNPEETLKMMKIFINDYLKKQKGIDVASEKISKSNDTTAYNITVPISFKESVAEDKQLNEFVGKELEDRNEPLYDKLVAGSGKSDTVEGEMLRAINRIVYRYYNDGDEYHTGYGTETAGPAHSYLVNANHPLRSLVSTLFKDGTNYEQTIKDVLDAILDHIESRQGKYTSNSEDMYDYEPEFEDDTYEEEDYDEYGYDDDDDYDEFDNEEQF